MSLFESISVGKNVIRIWEFRCKSSTEDEGNSQEIPLKRIILEHNPLTKEVQVTVDNHELPPGHTKFNWSSLPGYVSIVPSSEASWLSRLNGSYSYECHLNGQKLKENNERLNDTTDKVSDLKVSIPEVKKAGNGVVWYRIELDMKISFEENVTKYSCRVHRRFRDFRYLYSRVCAAFRHTHLLGSIPKPPGRKLKIVENHYAPEFLESRRIELENWLTRLLRLPRVASNPDVETFLGGLHSTREVSIMVPVGSLGVSLQQKKLGSTSAELYPQAEVSGFTSGEGDSVGVAEESGLIHVGDSISKISGESVINNKYSDIVRTLKTEPRPLVVHFVGPRTEDS